MSLREPPRPTTPGGRAQLEKLYYRIGEVAGIVGVEPHVLRYWETEFRSVRPQKSARGQRVYSRRDVDTLLKVKDLLYRQRFTIAGAKRRLREGGVEPAAPESPQAMGPAAAEAPSGAAAPEAAVTSAPAPKTATEDVVERAVLARVRDELLEIRALAVAFLEDLDDHGLEDAAIEAHEPRATAKRPAAAARSR